MKFSASGLTFVPTALFPVWSVEHMPSVSSYDDGGLCIYHSSLLDRAYRFSCVRQTCRFEVVHLSRMIVHSSIDTTIVNKKKNCVHSSCIHFIQRNHDPSCTTRGRDSLTVCHACTATYTTYCKCVESSTCVPFACISNSLNNVASVSNFQYVCGTQIALGQYKLCT